MEPEITGRKYLTLAIIGCGNLGTAILSGLLASHATLPEQSWIITQFLVCVQTAAQERYIRQTILENLGKNSVHVEFLIANNTAAARQANVIVLTCPPHQSRAVLSAEGMQSCLSGKLLISMMGGVSIDDIENTLMTKKQGVKPCHVLRAVTNVGAAVGSSVTIIDRLSASMPSETYALGKAILCGIGSVLEVRTEQMPAATALTASGTAFFALILEATVDGAVALGIRHDQAVQMAAHTMQGVASLALAGQHCASIRTQVITPGGSTARGIGVLEEGAVRGKITHALRETASMHTK